MAWEFQYKKPRKLTEEEITKWEKRLSKAEPYMDDEMIFDDPDWDSDRGCATLAKKILSDDRKYYPEFYKDK